MCVLGHRRRSKRSGYTLLEITVALGIAMLLLAGVYTAFSVSISQIQSGRNLIDQSSIARSVFMRLDDDISSHLGPIDPRLVKVPEELFQSAEEIDGEDSGGDTGQGGNSPSGSGSTGSGTGTASGTGGNSGSSASSTDPESQTVATVLFNMMVFGDSQRLVLFVNQADPLPQLGGMINPAFLPPSGLKRISYWVMSGPNGPLGLAREVVDLPTSDVATSQLPFEMQDPSFLFAKNVVGINFAYWDGTAWTDTWDGTQAIALEDKSIPVGPPLAIEVTLEIAQPGPGTSGQVRTRTYRHVFHLPTANGPVDPLASGSMITE